jgi:hypothetical protein
MAYCSFHGTQHNGEWCRQEQEERFAERERKHEQEQKASLSEQLGYEQPQPIAFCRFDRVVGRLAGAFIFVWCLAALIHYCLPILPPQACWLLGIVIPAGVGFGWIRWNSHVENLADGFVAWLSRCWREFPRYSHCFWYGFLSKVGSFRRFLYYEMCCEMRSSYYRWKRRRAATKFEVYMQKHDWQVRFDGHGNYIPPEERRAKGTASGNRSG